MRPSKSHCLALIALLAFSSGAAAETFLQRLLRVAGLTASPAQMRAPGDEIGSGEIWIATVGAPPPIPLTKSGGYRSPIFAPGDGGIFALEGDFLVRIPIAGGMPSKLAAAPGVAKLIGFDAASPDDIVVLLRQSSAPLGVLSLKSGKLTLLDYDPKSEADQRMLAQVRGQERVYGDATIYVNPEIKQGVSRSAEWTDVYLARTSLAPLNISMCNGVNCGQPALSLDGKRITFVKALE